ARADSELVPGQALVVSEPQEHPPERRGRKTRVRHGRLLPVEVRSRCAWLHARPEGGHGEAPVKRPAIVLLCARFGLLHLLASSGTCPFRPEVALPAPLRRRRCGSTGADPSSAARPRSRDPHAGLSAPLRLGEIAAPRLLTLTT